MPQILISPARSQFDQLNDNFQSKDAHFCKRWINNNTSKYYLASSTRVILTKQIMKSTRRLFTACKRSWRRLCFPRCLSVHRVGVSASGPGWVAPSQCMLGYGQQAGGTHPTGMHSCFSNISSCPVKKLPFKSKNNTLIDKTSVQILGSPMISIRYFI